MIHSRIRGLALVHLIFQAISSVAIFWLWFGIYFLIWHPKTFNFTKYGMYSLIVVLPFAIRFLRLDFTNLNLFPADSKRIYQNSLRQTSHILLTVLLYIVATKDPSISRLFLFSFILPLYGWMVVTNAFCPRWFGRWVFGGKRTQRTLLCGLPHNVEHFEEWLDQKLMFGLEIVGVVSHSSHSDSTPFLQRFLQFRRFRIPVIGSLTDFRSLVEQLRIHLVISIDGSTFQETACLHKECEAAGVRFIALNNLQDIFGRAVQAYQDGQIQVLAMRREPLECPINRFMKRGTDIGISLFVILFILPFTSLLVWICHQFQSPGPLFFRQRRGGYNRRDFVILKYRTMHVGHQREVDQATWDDNRVFILGRWMRRLSIDELPQFWNVLKGEMSIVGPRPHFIEHDELFEKAAGTYWARSFMKPGITGLAQIKGVRGEIKSPESIRTRVQWDLRYSELWTPFLDGYIMLQTFREVIYPSGSAY